MSSFRSRFVPAVAVSVAASLAAQAVVNRLRESSLERQVALVTGGSRGLGFLLARELGREGCRVAICARHADALAVAVEQLEAEGIEVFAAPCDIRDREAVERFVADATSRFGPIDVLVNNAGIIQVASVADLTVDDFEDAMATMYWGTLYPTLAVLPEMRRRRSGRIVNITSIGGVVSVPHLLPYTTAKFAAVGLSQGLRAELGRDGVSVTTVVPSLIRDGSYLNARFGGRQLAEFTWFSLGASAPFISMDPESTARRIVAAARRRESEITLGLPALAMSRFHGVFPGLTADIMGVVNRFLPAPADADAPAPVDRLVRGATIQGRMHSRAFEFATSLGRKAGERFNER